MAARFSLPWKYCECGCKSETLTFGGLYFSYYMDLRGGYWLSTQHHPLITGEKVRSFSEVSRRVRQALRKQKDVLQQQFDELKRL